MKFDIITIFPEAFSCYFSQSILERAQKKGLIKIAIHNLRDFASDKRKTVDDAPFGGGPGMVLKLEPLFKAVQALKPKTKNQKPKIRKRIILFSTRGKKFTEKEAKRLAKYKQLILICGRYEGVDERVAKYIADEEISVGDFVLSGGELPAMLVVDAVARFLPGVLGKKESLESIKGSYPVYTRPEIFSPFPEIPPAPFKKGGMGSTPRSGGRDFSPFSKGSTRRGRDFSPNKKTSWRVPKILLSGNHKKIAAWRQKFTLKKNDRFF